VQSNTNYANPPAADEWVTNICTNVSESGILESGIRDFGTNSYV